MGTAILLGPCEAMAKTANIDMSNGKDISLTESVKLVASSMAKGGPAKKNTQIALHSLSLWIWTPIKYTTLCDSFSNSLFIVL